MFCLCLRQGCVFAALKWVRVLVFAISIDKFAFCLFESLMKRRISKGGRCRYKKIWRGKVDCNAKEWVV